jgi:DNA-binding HxlR family transcriptional regulator
LVFEVTAVADDAEDHLEAALSVVGGPGKLLIVFHLRGGALRYGELRREMSQMSAPSMIRLLRDLEAAGVVLRNDHDERPPRVDYALTRYGRTLIPLVDSMVAWGERHVHRGAVPGEQN